MTSAPPHDPLEAIQVVHSILGDTLAVLKERERFPFSVADLPDLRAALRAAIYDGPLDEHCEACEKEFGGMCPVHRGRAQQCARWTELLHRPGVRAS